MKQIVIISLIGTLIILALAWYDHTTFTVPITRTIVVDRDSLTKADEPISLYTPEATIPKLVEIISEEFGYLIDFNGEDPGEIIELTLGLEMGNEDYTFQLDSDDTRLQETIRELFDPEFLFGIPSEELEILISDDELLINTFAEGFSSGWSLKRKNGNGKDPESVCRITLDELEDEIGELEDEIEGYSTLILEFTSPGHHKEKDLVSKVSAVADEIMDESEDSGIDVEIEDIEDGSRLLIKFRQ